MDFQNSGTLKLKSNLRKKIVFLASAGHYEDGDDFLHAIISKNYETAILP